MNWAGCSSLRKKKKRDDRLTEELLARKTLGLGQLETRKKKKKKAGEWYVTGEQVFISREGDTNTSLL